MVWKVTALSLLQLLETRLWARLPKLTLRRSRVKDVHNPRLRLGFQSRYRLPNEYSTTGRHIFPMIRMRKRRERLRKLLRTTHECETTVLSQSTATLLDGTWPLKPSFLFLATRRSWWWHNCIAPIPPWIRNNANRRHGAWRCCLEGFWKTTSCRVWAVRASRLLATLLRVCVSVCLSVCLFAP